MRDGTLCCVIKNNKILLMVKKRGLGKGKLTAPGGRLEDGETEEECAVREVEEEVCITPLGVRKVGVMEFSNGGDGMKVHIFESHDFTGDINETDEADPLWADVDKLPFEKMWQDYRLWLPLLLEGKRFEGRCLYTRDWNHIIDYHMEFD